jgi:hypothetical protein
LLTSGLSQPVDIPKPVVSARVPTNVIEMPLRQRVVYDWAAGERLVFDRGKLAPSMTSRPVVGITDEQVDRIVGASAS